MQLYVYDLSGGMARALSPTLLGHQIDGVWHTSVVVGGCEYYVGGGINVAAAGATPFGRPVQTIDLGATHLDADVREALLVDLSARYTPESYSLFDNNCNNFADDLAQLLTGRGVPAHIVGLPSTVLATPFGAMLRPMLAGLEAQMRGMRQQAFRPAEEGAAAGPGAGAAQAQADAGAALGAGADAAGPTASPSPPPPGLHPPLAPAVVAAEHEIETAVAEGAMAELDVVLEELDLKEGRQTPRQQLGDAAAARLATELAVKKEFDRLRAGGGVGDPREAEALAVEHVAAAAAAAAAAAGENGAKPGAGSDAAA